MLSSRFRSGLRICFVILLTCAAVRVGLALFQMVSLEMRGPLDPDALIYLTIGRGILHGARVYTDLFESKPPGIFYLSAVSLRLGGVALMRVLELGTLLLLPAILTVRGWRNGPQPGAIGFVFGGLLACWAQENGGGLQTEMFALLFCLAYVTSLDGRTWSRLVWRSVLLALVIGFREPFLLGIFAACLLTCETPRDWLYQFLVPLAIGVGLLGATLLTLGILGPYTHVYLPAMLGSRIQGGTLDPLPIRLLWVNRLWSSLTIYSSMPLLGYTFGSLWVWCVAAKVRLTRTGLVAVPLAVIGGAALIHEYYVLARLVLKAGSLGVSPAGVLLDPGFRLIGLGYISGTLLYLLLLVFIENARVLRAVGSGLLALLCLSLAIGIGGYEPNYLLFLLPAVLVMFFRLLNRPATPFLVPFAVLVCLTAFTYSPRTRLSTDTYPSAQRLSAQLDRLMDACHYDRYVFDGSYPVFALSRHSPVGPIFTPYFHNYLRYDHPLYLRTFANATSALVMLVPTNPPRDQNAFDSNFLHQFTTTTPPCAAGLPSPDGFMVLLRVTQLVRISLAPSGFGA